MLNTNLKTFIVLLPFIGMMQAAKVKVENPYGQFIFVPLNPKTKASTEESMNSDLIFDIKNNAQEYVLYGMREQNEPGFYCQIITTNDEKNMTVKVNYLPVGAGLPLPYSATVITHSSILEKFMNTVNYQNMSMSEDFLNLIDWESIEIQDANNQTFGMPAMQIKKIMKKGKFQLSLKDFNINFMDSYWLKAAEQLANYSPTSEKASDWNMVYGFLLNEKIDEFISVMELEIIDGDDIGQHVRKNMENLKKLKSVISNLLKNLSEFDLHIEGQEVNMNNMKFLTKNNRSPDDIAPDDRSIFYMNKEKNKSYFNVSDLSKVITNNSMWFTGFNNALKNLKSAVTSGFGFGVGLFISARNTHFATSGLSNNDSMNYFNLHHDANKLEQMKLNEKSFSRFIADMSEKLVVDSFVTLNKFWKKAAYGHEFLKAVYGKVIQQAKQEIMAVKSNLNDSSFSDMVKDIDMAFDVDSIDEVIAYNPLLAIFKKTVYHIALNSAEEFYNNNTGNKLYKNGFKSANLSFLINNFFLPGFNSGEVAYPLVQYKLSNPFSELDIRRMRQLV